LGLLELLLGIPTSSVGEPDSVADLNVVLEGNILDLNAVGPAVGISSNFE